MLKTKYNNSLIMIFRYISLLLSFLVYLPAVLIAESELDSISVELKSIASRAEQAQKKAEDLKAWEVRQIKEIATIEKQLNDLIKKEENLAAELDQISDNVVLIQEEVKQLYKEESVLIERRKRRLLAVEAIEPADMLVKVISIETSGFDEQIGALSAAIQRSDDILASEIKSVRKELAARAKSIAKLFNEQRLIHKQIRDEREQIALLLGKKQKLQKDIADQRKAREEQAIKLNSEVLKLETIKQELFERSTLTFDKDSNSDQSKSVLGSVVESDHLSTPLFKKSSLRWPIKGVIKKYFGREDPSKQGLKNGVLVEANSGSSVDIKAVERGVVGFVGQIPFYGLSVILSHGPNEYSLYGSLAKVNVKPSDKLAAGAQVGAVSEKDKELYFELRMGNKSVNPAPFLQK